jgi:hypothetical protein
MQVGKKSPIPVLRFERLGLIRFALTLPRELSKLSRADTHPEHVAAAEARAFRAAFEAKKAEAFCGARMVLTFPR